MSLSLVPSGTSGISISPGPSPSRDLRPPDTRRKKLRPRPALYAPVICRHYPRPVSSPPTHALRRQRQPDRSQAHVRIQLRRSKASSPPAALPRRRARTSSEEPRAAFRTLRHHEQRHGSRDQAHAAVAGGLREGAEDAGRSDAGFHAGERLLRREEAGALQQAGRAPVPLLQQRREVRNHPQGEVQDRRRRGARRGGGGGDSGGAGAGGGGGGIPQRRRGRGQRADAEGHGRLRRPRGRLRLPGRLQEPEADVPLAGGGHRARRDAVCLRDGVRDRARDLGSRCSQGRAGGGAEGGRGAVRVQRGDQVRALHRARPRRRRQEHLA